jgi:dTDP-4-dehydrorhamnose reductase
VAGRTDTILVTGGDGQLGRAVVDVAAARGLRAVGLGRVELDVLDAARVRSVIEQTRPRVVVHCAAWTAVDDAQAERAAAFALNEQATHHVAEAAAAAGSQLAVVSTDYVFAGTQPDGYVESDAVDPVNVYGASKLAGERAAVAAHPGALVARTAWLFADEGANFVRTILRLAAGRDSIEVVTDQVGSPTYAPHLAAALLDCIALELTGIAHLAGAPSASWFEVAGAAVDAAGLDCRVLPTTSDRFPRPAPRPACSILRSERSDVPAVGSWRDGVQAVVRHATAVGTPA